MVWCLGNEQAKETSPDTAFKFLAGAILVVEFTAASVILEVNRKLVEPENDFVWIFAGGTPPNDFLKKIGVQFGTKDMTQEASEEAKQTRLASQSFAEARAGAG